MKFLCYVLALLVCPVVSGQPTVVNEDHKMIASDGFMTDSFSKHVSVSGTLAIIGAMGADDNGANSGAAYIFRFDGVSWIEETKLFASDAHALDFFGVSVAIENNIAVVGARGNDDSGGNSGSAYVFRFNGISWVEETKLLASDATNGDNFGNSAAISGNTVIIGAYWDAAQSGSAYIYRYDGSTWVEEVKLQASDWNASDYFAQSVSISGNFAIVGSHQNDDQGTNSGSAYIFQYDGSTWSEQIKLLASDGVNSTRFGTSVSISGDIAVVGSDASAAYIFQYDGTSWNEETILQASDSTIVPIFFGKSVSISNNLVLVGAFYDNDNGSHAGAAYIYRQQLGSWVEEAKLLASDGAIDDWLGYHVSISGNTAFVGSPNQDNINGSNAGAVYVFDIFDPDADDDGVIDTIDNCFLFNPDQADCNGNDIGDVCDIAKGTSLDVNGDGIPDECQCLADLNSDGLVDIGDLLVLIATWGSTSIDGDVNLDGIVDLLDLLFVIANWGDCP